MAVCVFDNPATMQRECWQDGKLVVAYSVGLIEGREPIPPEHFFFGANIGRWKTGQLVGVPEAVRCECESCQGARK